MIVLDTRETAGKSARREYRPSPRTRYAGDVGAMQIGLRLRSLLGHGEGAAATRKKYETCYMLIRESR